MASESVFIVAVFLLASSLCTAASAARSTLPPGFCSVGTPKAIRCQKPGTVCAVSTIGDPDHGIPHNGTCHKFAPSLMCNYLPTSTYYEVGVTFPSGDGCNTCTCGGSQRKGSNATVVCSKTPVADCFADPCRVSKCPAFPAATCEANYCGGCNADWFVNGHKVDCNASSPSHTIPCRQGGNVKPIECPESYSCYLNPVSSPLPNKDASRQGVCLPTVPAPAPAKTQAVCRQGGNIAPVNCPSGQICQLQGPVPRNPDVARTGICVPAPTRAPAPTPTQKPAGCQCDNSTSLVCGQDGVTYQNACKAKCNGASFFPGPCGSCNCPLQWAPVCGSDNHTYINTCDAECHGISGPYKQGECGAHATTCGCSKESNPVCGSDGKTYSNACLAKCAKLSYFPGACGQCICIALYDPVCSSNGSLYGNQCEALCHGASPPFSKPGIGGICAMASESKTGQ